MIKHFNAHTIDCVCHTIRSMFRVLGIYNFGMGQGISLKSERNNQWFNYP